jgi:hypothetical protein
MTMTLLSHDTATALREAGFPRDRTPNPELIERARSSGFEPTGSFVAFLAMYEGLRILHPSLSAPTFEAMHLDIKELGIDFDPATVEEYSERTGLALIPIGEAYNGHLLLAMDQHGALYGAYDRYLTKLGENIEDGLNAIFEKRRTPAIP